MKLIGKRKYEIARKAAASIRSGFDQYSSLVCM